MLSQYEMDDPCHWDDMSIGDKRRAARSRTPYQFREPGSPQKEIYRAEVKKIGCQTAGEGGDVRILEHLIYNNKIIF